MQLTDKQKRKLQKLAKLVESGDVAVLEHLFEIEEKLAEVEDRVETDVNLLKDALEPKLADILDQVKGKDGAQGEKGEKGDKGDTGATGPAGLDGRNGVDGKDGLNGLNGKDGLDGLNGQDGLNGKDGSPDTAEQVRDKLETLKDNERLDITAIKGLDKDLKGLSDSLTQRAVSIVDNRTSFLINKTTALKDELDNKITSYTTDKLTVSATAPSNPQLYDLWVDIS